MVNHPNRSKRDSVLEGQDLCQEVERLRRRVDTPPEVASGPRPGTVKARMMEAMLRPGGASGEEIQAITGASGPSAITPTPAISPASTACSITPRAMARPPGTT